MLFYGGRNLVVADEEILVLRGATSLRFRVDELRDVHIEQSDLHPLRSHVGHAVGALMVLAGAAWHLSAPPALQAAILFSLLGGTAGYIVVRRLHPRRSELWADYRGADVRLFWSSDAIEFGRVTRAVVRALAANRSRSRSTWA